MSWEHKGGSEGAALEVIRKASVEGDFGVAISEKWIGKDSPAGEQWDKAWSVIWLECKGRDVGSFKEVAQDSDSVGWAESHA